ncbi:MAG: bacteriohemerythrin [Alphaproteobacteria bacterium]
MQTAFTWSKDYETGNTMVDQEHKALLELVNLILEVDQKKDIEEREQALRVELAALHRYVGQHFTNEEQLLDAVGSPHFAKQCLQHNVLRSELSFFWVPGQEIPAHETIHELAVWSKEHLLNHFLTVDFKAFHEPPFMD